MITGDDIIVRLQGGLGNQMFQVAAALAWMRKSPGRLWVHLANYHSENNRPYLLDLFSGPIQPMERRSLRWILANEREIKNGNSDQPRLTWLARLGGWKLISDPAAVPMGRAGKVYLDGFWQDSTLVSLVAETCLSCFSFKSAPLVDPIVTQIEAKNSVAVHVRRGDFLGQPGFKILGPSYYQRAVERIQDYLPAPQFFVFSDEPPLARELIIWPKHTVFFPAKTGRQAVEDFYLMSRASNHIISNSTFSWWSAWLAAGDRVVHPLMEGSKIYCRGAFSRSQGIGLSLEE